MNSEEGKESLLLSLATLLLFCVMRVQNTWVLFIVHEVHQLIEFPYEEISSLGCCVDAIFHNQELFVEKYAKIFLQLLMAEIRSVHNVSLL